MFDYPYFIDIRPDGMNPDSPVTAGLPQVSMAWASPITLRGDGQGERRLIELLRSSPGAWLSESTDINPTVGPDGFQPFQPQGDTGSRLLGVASTGQFSSYFAGKPSPLLPREPPAQSPQESPGDPQSTPGEPPPPTATGVIERSPESARIVLFSSNDFLNDQVVALAGVASGSEYLNSLDLMANTVDWALADDGLMSIRSRGQFNRTLPPMDHDAQVFWEYLNYALAALALVLVALVRRRRRQRRGKAYLAYLQEETA